LGILFSSILCTCPNQYNLCNLGKVTIQLDATMKFYSTQHVSGIDMPIIRSTKQRTIAYGVQHCNKVQTVRFDVVVMCVVV
jgi:hypothetical protein